jgi:hypothetical protein
MPTQIPLHSLAIEVGRFIPDTRHAIKQEGRLYVCQELFDRLAAATEAELLRLLADVEVFEVPPRQSLFALPADIAGPTPQSMNYTAARLGLDHFGGRRGA